MKLTTPHFDLDVEGLCFEVTNTFAGEVRCCGFDSLVVDSAARFASTTELFETLTGTEYKEVMTALNEQAQADYEGWQVTKAELRKFLRR